MSGGDAFGLPDRGDLDHSLRRCRFLGRLAHEAGPEPIVERHLDGCLACNGPLEALPRRVELACHIVERQSVAGRREDKAEEA